MNFITVNGPSLVSKYVGESEKAIREVFSQAREAHPCIIFFDEFDSIAPARTVSAQGEHGNRLVTQLLVEMDGFEEIHDVFCLAATNRLEAIDPALLRPGRFDRVVQVPLPDATTRRKILEVHLRKKPVEPNINMDDLVDLSEGLSGADIYEACRRAAVDALRRVLANTGHLEPCVSHRQLVDALTSMTGGRKKVVNSPRALVLDDDESVLEYTSLALETGNFEAVSFSHPYDALNAIQVEAFDLAILDINMPEMNGLQVLARIRAVQPNLPVIMISGRHDAATAIQSFRLGAVDYLEKPASVLQIRDAAQKAFVNSRTVATKTSSEK